MMILGQAALLGLLAVSPVWPGARTAPPINADTAPTVEQRTPAPYPIKRAGAIEPVVQAKSALLVDLPSGTTLYSKDASKQLPIASLTKLMTALLVVERTDPGQTVTVPADLGGRGLDESRMGLRNGDVLQIDSLVAGTLIASANDASNLLARQVGGSEDEFVELMNQRADELGLEDTRFENPSGYGRGENYSTARDLAVLSRAALANQRIRDLVAVKEVVITPVQGQPYPINNTDDLLGSYLPIAGLKTGTSDAAGPCLVSLLSAGDRQILAIVLNSPARFQENKSMLDWALRAYQW